MSLLSVEPPPEFPLNHRSLEIGGNLVTNRVVVIPNGVVPPLMPPPRPAIENLFSPPGFCLPPAPSPCHSHLLGRKPVFRPAPVVFHDASPVDSPVSPPLPARHPTVHTARMPLRSYVRSFSLMRPVIRTKGYLSFALSPPSLFLSDFSIISFLSVAGCLPGHSSHSGCLRNSPPPASIET